METPKISNKQRKRRSLLLVLPLLALPFLTMAFWSMGGGSGGVNTNLSKTGLNTALPSPQFKNEVEKNKMELYAQADKDSLGKREEQQKDPFFKMAMNFPEADTTSLISATDAPANRHNEVNMKGYKDLNGEKVLRKIAELNKALDQSVSANPDPGAGIINSTEDREEPTANMEKISNAIADSDKATDAQMQQMESMLDKILDIQHPDQAAEKSKQLSLKNKQQIYPVNATHEVDNITLLENKTRKAHRSVLTVAGTQDSIEIPVVSFDEDSISENESITAKPKKTVCFYGLNEDDHQEEELQNSLEAIIPETQTLTTGATLKLQLLNDCYIGGTLMKSGQFLYGLVSLNGERLEVNIHSLKSGKNIMPVSLSVYDIDGLAGIYMPGAISRDVSKESAEQAIQAVNVMSYDPSLAAQATGAGIQAAKAFMSKKVKLIRVTVKAGYKVMLRDNKQNM